MVIITPCWGCVPGFLGVCKGSGRCSGFSGRCSGVFRVFWKVFRGVPGFLEGVPGCSGFFTLFWVFRGVPGCSGVPCSGVPCSGVPGITTCRSFHLQNCRKDKHVIHQPWSVRIGKTVPSVLSTALGLRPWAVLKTSGTVFPYTDLPAGEYIDTLIFQHKNRKI